MLDLGTTGTNSYINTGNNLQFSGGTITFGTTGASGDGGVYSGSSGKAAAPYLGATQTTADTFAGNYLASEPKSSVTIAFTETQQYFGLLWGTIDAANTLTFYNGTTAVYTITGQNLITNNGATSGKGSLYVSVNIPTGYTSVVASQASSSPAFEFADVTYSSETTSNQSTTGTSTTVVVDNSSGVPLCFLAGTRIATARGEVEVQALKAGDLVLTAQGQAVPVRWIGVKTVSALFSDPLRLMPVRIKAGAIAENMPKRDLLVSPEHAMFIGGVLVQAGAMVNGTSISRESDMPQRFTYYHVELADHALILAEGAPAETFVDNVDRMAFDNWAEHEALFGQGDAIAEMEYPRAKAARQVPAAVRALLVGRAEVLNQAQAA
jgi:hypothetical protein